MTRLVLVDDRRDGALDVLRSICESAFADWLPLDIDVVVTGGPARPGKPTIDDRERFKAVVETAAATLRTRLSVSPEMVVHRIHTVSDIDEFLQTDAEGAGGALDPHEPVALRDFVIALISRAPPSHGQRVVLLWDDQLYSGKEAMAKRYPLVDSSGGTNELAWSTLSAIEASHVSAYLILYSYAELRPKDPVLAPQSAFEALVTASERAKHGRIVHRANVARVLSEVLSPRPMGAGPIERFLVTDTPCLELRGQRCGEDRRQAAHDAFGGRVSSFLEPASYGTLLWRPALYYVSQVALRSILDKDLARYRWRLERWSIRGECVRVHNVGSEKVGEIRGDGDADFALAVALGILGQENGYSVYARVRGNKAATPESLKGSFKGCAGRVRRHLKAVFGEEDVLSNHGDLCWDFAGGAIVIDGPTAGREG